MGKRLGGVPFRDKIYSGAEIDALLEGKQDVLEFDDTPTEGSSNPVTSDGISKALSARKTDRIVAPGGMDSVIVVDDGMPVYEKLIPAAARLDWTVGIDIIRRGIDQGYADLSYLYTWTGLSEGATLDMVRNKVGLDQDATLYDTAVAVGLKFSPGSLHLIAEFDNTFEELVSGDLETIHFKLTVERDGSTSEYECHAPKKFSGSGEAGYGPIVGWPAELYEGDENVIFYYYQQGKEIMFHTLGGPADYNYMNGAVSTEYKSVRKELLTEVGTLMKFNDAIIQLGSEIGIYTDGTAEILTDTSIGPYGTTLSRVAVSVKKTPGTLTLGRKTFDGSESVEVSTEDIGAADRDHYHGLLVDMSVPGDIAYNATATRIKGDKVELGHVQSSYDENTLPCFAIEPGTSLKYVSTTASITYENFTEGSVIDFNVDSEEVSHSTYEKRLVKREAVLLTVLYNDGNSIVRLCDARLVLTRNTSSGAYSPSRLDIINGDMQWLSFDLYPEEDRVVRVVLGTVTLELVSGSITAKLETTVRPVVFIKDGEIGGGSDLLVEKTWSELKAMRNGGTLVPGQQYRITDYEATTRQSDTRSANHPFDIIVTADAANKLNEEARAIQHDGDTYFSNSKIEAWKVWYCIDNDINRFSWACSMAETGFPDGKGVVYRLIDEFDNDVPYDFKGIQFKAYGDTDDVWRYTFDSGSVSDNTDGSLIGDAKLITIATRRSAGLPVLHELNRIVFKGQSFENTIGDDCWDITFGGVNQGNTIGSGCYQNKFGEYCSFNILGPSCVGNTFGDWVFSTILSCACSNNRILGTYCLLGTGCQDNVIESGSYNVTFGACCKENHIGSSCSDVNFANGCRENRIGGNSATITFGTSCRNVIFGVKPPNFSDSAAYSVGDMVYRNGYIYKCTVPHTGSWSGSHFSRSSATLIEYYSNITIENGVVYLFLECTSTPTAASKYQNVTVSSGIAGSQSSHRLIQDTEVGQAVKTIYQPAGSRVISV